MIGCYCKRCRQNAQPRVSISSMTKCVMRHTSRALGPSRTKTKTSRQAKGEMSEQHARLGLGRGDTCQDESPSGPTKCQAYPGLTPCPLPISTLRRLDLSRLDHKLHYIR